ncbi:hypothetical protein DCAR_0103696 [Daucus carota subsp. sativus]|uniref:Uncharacterized protein n=1 Tax=Daucus carota subsp. sativus TaxID=79200 RepID=A0A166I7Q6_DAUCS|nr:PREDICTED: uncharacterized protein LOC108223215 [Daucus carota subsp. sativus]WOG84512.1 hypothetical protein DCAR_0103696 [Daucus carota subsp. sativus]
MSISFEALAMAGADYHERGISMEEWERSEMMTPPHLLAEEEEEEEREDHRGHMSSGESVPVFFSSSSRNGEEEYCRDKYKGEKKLGMIKLVKQLSSKTMMIERMLPAETSLTPKVEPWLWKNLLRVLILEFRRMFSL